MPPNRNRNSPPRLRRGGASTKPAPEVMTWPRATPVLVVAAIFDALRFMFEWFIFFGPALLGAACTIGANSALGTNLSGTPGQLVGGTCVAISAVAGFFGAGITEAFGMVMAMITGLAGWLIIGLILVMFNGRIFKENALWFGASLLLSEIPFVGSLPFFTGTLWKMYSHQIKIEKAAHKKWEQENAARLRQEQERQALEQSQFLQQQQADQQTALDTEWAVRLAQQDEDQEAQETAGDEFGGMQFNQQGEGNEETIGAGVPETVRTGAPQIPVVRPTPVAGSAGVGGSQPMIHDYGMGNMPSPLVAPISQPRETIDTSRRTFLKQAGALVGGSVLSSFPIPSVAQMTKKEAGQTYAQGMEALRQDALFGTNERIAFFVMKTDGTTSWLNIPESEVESSPNAVFFPYIDELVHDKRILAVDLVHTHPLSSDIYDSTLISEMRNGVAEPRAMPPSLKDVMLLTMGRNKYYKGISHEFSVTAVDPAGVWRAEIGHDPKNLLFMKKAADETEAITNKLYSQSDVLATLKEMEREGVLLDPNPMWLQKNSARFSPGTNQLVKDRLKIDEELNKNKAFTNFMTNVYHSPVNGHKVLSDPKKLAEIIKTYKDIGVDLTFTPHPRIVHP